MANLLQGGTPWVSNTASDRPPGSPLAWIAGCASSRYYAGDAPATSWTTFSIPPCPASKGSQRKSPASPATAKTAAMAPTDIQTEGHRYPPVTADAGTGAIYPHQSTVINTRST